MMRNGGTVGFAGAAAAGGNHLPGGIMHPPHGMHSSQSMMAIRGGAPIEGGGALPNPFSMFTNDNEYFLHNEVRSVDLDKEER